MLNLNGRTTSKYFKLKKGTSQRDPISAYLFTVFLFRKLFFWWLAKDNQNLKPLIIFGHDFLSLHMQMIPHSLLETRILELILECFWYFPCQLLGISVVISHFYNETLQQKLFKNIKQGFTQVLTFCYIYPCVTSWDWGVWGRGGGALSFGYNKTFGTMAVISAGFFPSTFLQSVNSCKNSILNWVLKLNFFKSLQVLFFVYSSRKTLDGFFIFYTIVFALVSLKTYKTNMLNYSIWNSMKKYLQLHSKNQKQTCWWCRCCFFFVSACITHSLVERLSVLTVLLGNKDQSPRNVEA